MKSHFFEHYAITEADRLHVWKYGIIILDANVLLDFYRWPETVYDPFIEGLSKVRDRLWSPHQVAKEYHNNRINVIGDQASRYDPFVKDFTKIMDTLDSGRYHPFVSKDTRKHLEDVLDTVKKESVDKQQRLLGMISDDSILDTVTNLYTGKVGNPFDTKELKQIYEEAEQRYKTNIPPGYADTKKPAPDKYGDYIVWKQILDKAKSSKLPIIFVTSDMKNDWWLKDESDKILGPRPELKRELYDHCKANLLMFTPSKFMDNATAVLGGTFTADSITDLKDLEKLRTNDNDSSSMEIGDYLQLVTDTDYLIIPMIQDRIDRGEPTDQILTELVGHKTRVKEHLEMAKRLNSPYYINWFQRDIKTIIGMIKKLIDNY